MFLKKKYNLKSNFPREKKTYAILILSEKKFDLKDTFLEKKLFILLIN